jgi:Tfp pilus assembly protein PilO
MKLNKIKEAFDSFLEKRVVPLDKKIVIAIFVLIIIAPVVAFYFLHFTAKTKEIKGLENKAVKLRKEIAGAKARAAKLDEHLAEMEETQRLFAEASVLLPHPFNQYLRTRHQFRIEYGSIFTETRAQERVLCTDTCFIEYNRAIS